MFPGQIPGGLILTQPTLPPPFEPKYIDPPPIVVNPWGGSETLNPIYFATEDTAKEVCKLLGGLSTFSRKFDLPAFGASPVDQWWVRFTGKYGDSKERVAGVLADLIHRECVSYAKTILQREGIYIL